jgi:glycosyltransferase involved in cell wall biosynthesis
MRILCVNDLPLGTGGGAEVYATRLNAALRKRGHEIELFAGEVTHVGAARALDLWDPVARSTLIERIRETQPDVVHFHNVIRDLSVATLLVPAPRVLTAHDMRLAGIADPRDSLVLRAVDAGVKRPLDRFVARHALDEIVAVSNPVAEHLRAAGFARVTTLELPAAKPAGPVLAVERCADLAYVGRISEDKGLRVLLAAWARISDHFPTERLLIAGDGPLLDELSRTPQPGVTFLGRLAQADVSRLLGSVRGVIVPSLPRLRPEAGPLSVVEAAAHGRPVIGSDDPGVVALASGLPGCRVLPAGDVDALAAAMLALLRDAASAARDGRVNAAAARKRHDADRLAEKMEPVFAAAIQGYELRTRAASGNSGEQLATGVSPRPHRWRRHRQLTSQRSA